MGMYHALHVCNVANIQNMYRRKHLFFAGRLHGEIAPAQHEVCGNRYVGIHGSCGHGQRS